MIINLYCKNYGFHNTKVITIVGTIFLSEKAYGQESSHKGGMLHMKSHLGIVDNLASSSFSNDVNKGTFKCGLCLEV